MDLRSAGSLLADGSYRAAASRAYYSIFYVASALLLEQNLEFSKHSAVIAAFGQHWAGKGLVPAEYHRYFIDAEEKRGIADYDFETMVTKEDVKRVISYAEKFVALGEQILGPVTEHEDE